MRIGFTGAHGTGKTSLMNELIALPNFADYDIIESSSREVARAGLQINQEADLLSQSLILQMRIAKELRVPDYANYISDRTPVDSIAYFAYQMNRIWSPSKAAELMYEAQWTMAEEHMKRYDLVVYFEPFDFITADGVRKTDEKYQRAIDVYVLSCLGLMSVPYVKIGNGSVEDRAAEVINMIHLKNEQS